MARLVLFALVVVLVIASLGIYDSSLLYVEAAGKWGGWKPTKGGQGGAQGGPPRGGGGAGGRPGGEGMEGRGRPGGPGGAGGPGGQKPPKDGGDQYDFDKMGPPGQNGGQKPKIDKCLKQALRHCDLGSMERDFAGFIKCIAVNKANFREDCKEWAANHEPCVEEIGVLCGGKNPPDTTDCMMNNRDDFGGDCKDSQFFKSMVEGYEQYKKNSESEGKKPKDPDYHKKSHKDFENHEEVTPKNPKFGGSGSDGEL